MADLSGECDQLRIPPGAETNIPIGVAHRMLLPPLLLRRSLLPAFPGGARPSSCLTGRPPGDDGRASAPGASREEPLTMTVRRTPDDGGAPGDQGGT